MSARTRCKQLVSNCNYCITGFYKRPARRKERHAAKRMLKAL